MYHTLQASLSTNNASIVNNRNCINCKYFHNSMLGAKYGKCVRFEKQDIINWKLQYSYAFIVRKHQCNGEYYEEKQNITSVMLNYIQNNIDKNK